MPKIDAYPQGAPCFVQLMTADQEAAKSFYGELFGWSLSDMPVSDDGDYYVRAGLDGEFVAGIAYYSNPAMPHHPAFWSVFLAVDDVDAVAARVPGLGGVVEQGPFDVMTFGRQVMIQDPTKARVNLWQAATAGNVGTGIRDEVGTPCWNELVTPDVDTAATFYTELLGVSWSSMALPGDSGSGDAGSNDAGSNDAGPGMDYRFMQAAGQNVAGATTPMQEGLPPHWNVTFYVADVDATVAQAKALDGRVLADAFDMPSVGRVAWLSDAQGGAFWVMHELEAA